MTGIAVDREAQEWQETLARREEKLQESASIVDEFPEEI